MATARPGETEADHFVPEDDDAPESVAGEEDPEAGLDVAVGGLPADEAADKGLLPGHQPQSRTGSD